jgi:hypothetical protein
MSQIRARGMRRFVRPRRVAAVLAVVAGLGLASGPALATTYPNTTWAAQATAPVTRSTSVEEGVGTAIWNTHTHTLQLQVTTATLGEGNCVTVYFDWTAKGHRDARALRDCASNDSITHKFTEVTPSNITAGPHKLGVCYGHLDHQGVCVFGATGRIKMNWHPWPIRTSSSPCDLSWVQRDVTGATTSFIDPHPKNPGYHTAKTHTC